MSENTHNNETISGDKREKGFALVLSLVIMAAMTAIGLAAVTTATTDLMIARNEKEARDAFYLAEAGIQEAVVRSALPEGETKNRRVGETAAERNARQDYWSSTDGGKTANTYNGFFDNDGNTTHVLSKNSFNSSTASTAGTAASASGIVSGGGEYRVTVSYVKEDEHGWNETCSNADASTCTDVIVYCRKYGFPKAPSDCRTALPVYKIVSIGTTKSGTTATIEAYITAAGINMLPPGDTILFTEGEIDLGGGGGGGTIYGKVASEIDKTTNSPYTDNKYVNSSVKCSKVVPDPPAANTCYNVSSTINYGPNLDYDNSDGEGMITYLGVPVSELKYIANITYDQTGTNVQYPQNSDPAGVYGTPCNPNDTGSAYATHVCDNDSNIIYIDNGSIPDGTAVFAGNTVGRGILIVTGNMRVSGNVLWEGMIYVMGQLEVTGTINLYGTSMIEGDGASDDLTTGSSHAPDVKVSGGLKVYGSREVAQSVMIGMQTPTMLRWARK